MKTFDRGAAGRSAGAEQHDVRSGELAPKVLAHAGGEAVAVGVEAVPAALRPAQGVDCADRARGGIDLRHAVEGDDLVRHGEVDAAEFSSVEEIERARQILGADFKPEIFPVEETSGVACERG